ncbi:MAG: mercuric transporter MerT family protein [Methylocella sp.]
MAQLNTKGSLIAGAAAVFGGSLCCVAPLVLLTLGIGGTWVATLTALEEYRPIIIGLTLLFLVLAFRRLAATSHRKRARPARLTPIHAR